MIKHGPVDVVVLAAGEPRFDGSVFAELERQAGWVGGRRSIRLYLPCGRVDPRRQSLQERIKL